MKFLNWIKYFFTHLFKRIFQIIGSTITSIIVGIVCGLIYIVTFEPGTYKKVTKRKIRRIRFLTKVKLYFYKFMRHFYKFPRYGYLPNLYNKFHFLIDK